MLIFKKKTIETVCFNLYNVMKIVGGANISSASWNFAPPTVITIQECPPQFEERIMARVYVRSITRSTMNQKAPFC